MHVAAALVAHDPDGGLDERQADATVIAAVMRVDDELQLPGPLVAFAIGLTRELGVADRVVVARLPCDEPGETLAAALHEVEPLVLAEGRMLVDPCCHFEQLGHRLDVAATHLSLDLEPRRHERQGTGYPARYTGRCCTPK